MKSPLSPGEIFKLIEKESLLLDQSFRRFCELTGFPMKQGSYSSEDYKAIPSHYHAQMINGYLIIPPPVPDTHQRIIVEALYQLTNFIKDTDSDYKAVAPPFRFCPPQNLNSTLLLPDIAVVRHPGRLLTQEITAIPDFIAEAAAPGTVYLDYFRKKDIYRSLGVKEYWIIDSQSCSIQTNVYMPEGNYLARTFSFSDNILTCMKNGPSLCLKAFLSAGLEK